jgi:hypothetical protein
MGMLRPKIETGPGTHGTTKSTPPAPPAARPPPRPARTPTRHAAGWPRNCAVSSRRTRAKGNCGTSLPGLGNTPGERRRPQPRRASQTTTRPALAGMQRLPNTSTSQSAPPGANVKNRRMNPAPAAFRTSHGPRRMPALSPPCPPVSRPRLYPPCQGGAGGGPVPRLWCHRITHR